MTDLGVLVDPLYKPSELLEIAQRIEKAGFSSFWYPDEKYFRDCYVGLSLVAANTHRIRLGPCVTDPYSRHPIYTAVSVASLAEIAPHRVWLGLGAGGRGLAEIGIQQKSPATALREAVIILRDLLDGKTANYSGKIISITNRPLDFHPPTGIKLMIGTGHGRLIQQLAGEVADVVMLANYATPEIIQRGLRWVQKGSEQAQRKMNDIFLISRVDLAIHVEGDLARKAMAPKIMSSFRASYPDLNYLEDLPEMDIPSGFLTALKKKDYQSRMFYADPVNSAPLIPPVLIDTMSIAGTPQAAAERIASIMKMGCFNEITIRPILIHNQTMTDFLDLFSQTVLPALTTL